MTTSAEWQGAVGRTWADLARLTDRAFAGLTERLLDAIMREPGGEVLDIGCGAGELGMAVAKARPFANVTGCDISPDLVDVARIRGEALPNYRVILGDAGSTYPPSRPDLLISRHGVMFFDNPVIAFTHLSDISRSGARLVFSCFRGMEDNAWASEVAAVMQTSMPSPPAPLYIPGPFAFRDSGLVRQILSSSGWGDIAIVPVAFRYVAGRGDDPVADATAFFSRIGPCAAAMRQADSRAREDLRHRLRGVLMRWVNGDAVIFPAAAWIVTATRR